MASRSAYDSLAEGPLEVSRALDIEAPADPPRLEDLRVRKQELDSGRSLELESPGDGSDVVTVRSPTGAVELRVTLTEEGPVLHFQAAQLALESQGKLELRCDELDVHARGDIRQVAGGDHEQVVLGDSHVAVSGDLSSQARTTQIESRRGDVRIRANDDVRLNGERVKLNCS